MAKTDKKTLNTKQAAFVREYLIDLNATQAAIRAGYSKKTAEDIGRQLLRKPPVAEAIKEAMDIRAQRTEVTADYVINTIVETIERCRQSAPVLDRKGEQVLTETPDGSLAKAYVFDSKGVLKGCELLGKHLNLFTDKIEHSGKVEVEQSQISDVDLARRVAFILNKASKEP